MTGSANSCLFSKCPFATGSGVLKGTYAVYPSVLISQPNMKGMTPVGNDLISSNELQGRVIQTEGDCPLQSVFILDTDGPHTLKLAGLDRELAKSQSFNGLFRPCIDAKETQAEHLVLPAYEILEAENANVFSLLAVHGNNYAFYEPYEASHQRVAVCLVVGGRTAIGNKFEIKAQEAEMERSISAISTVVPDFLDALDQLTPERNSEAILTITAGAGENPEFVFELQSKMGGVWLKTFRLSAEDRAQLFTIFDIFNGIYPVEIPH